MENEIVILKRNRTATTSLIVAEKFGKRHDRLLRKIEDLIEDDNRGLLFFGESSYMNLQNKEQKMYVMDRKSFSILVMSFTGKKAIDWKIKFYDAFEAMELAIVRQQNIAWEQARLEGKQTRYELTDGIQEFIAYAEQQGSRNARMYYVQITKMTNQTLFLIGRKAPQNFRDMLDNMQLSFLQTAEFVARNALRDGMQTNMFYKDIYVLARDKVTAFAATVEQTPVLGNPVYEQIAYENISGVSH
jgi:Rha family phage regulatory protein